MWASAWHLLGNIEKVSAWIDSINGIVDSPAVINWKHTLTRRYGQCEFQYGKEFNVPSLYYANDEWFDISGSKGVLVIHRCTANIVQGPAVSVFNDGTWTHYQAETDWSAGFIGSTHNFIDAILGRAEPVLDGKQARHILAVDLAIAKSDRLQRTVYVYEFDAPVPSFHALHRWLAERKAKRVFRTRLAGKGKITGRDGEPGSLANRARELTLALQQRFDASAADGLEGSFGLRFTDEQDCGPFSVRLASGCVEIEEGEIPDTSMFVIRSSRADWSAILLGKSIISGTNLQALAQINPS